VFRSRIDGVRHLRPDSDPRNRDKNGAGHLGFWGTKMDQITQALVSGVAKLAEPAIKDAYDALKRAITRKLGSHGEVTKAIESLEARPDSAGRRDTLAEEVRDSPAGADAELLKLADALMALVKAQAPSQTVVQQEISGRYNNVSGTGDININTDHPAKTRPR
jgi:hypothetical protein